MRIIRILLVLVLAAVAAVYTIQDMSGQYSAADEPPVLTCDTDTLEVSVRDDERAMLAGVTATDAQDGDLSGQVLISGVSKLISDNTARITYVVFDSDDNMATLTRYIRYTDYHCPRFSLSEPLIYAANEEISLLDRLHATDAIDGDITNAIRVSYTEGTSDPEVYTVDVQVTNSMGDTAWLTLPVIILQGEGARCEVRLSTYLLYLDRGDSFSPAQYLERASFGGESLSAGNVDISSQVDTDTPGTYQVRYTCTYGTHTGAAILTVVVE